MTKGSLAQKFWDSIPEDRQEKIIARAERRIEAYQNLQELRKSAGITQVKVSEALDISQGNLSRLERNSDMLLSTLQGYVNALGGTLNLMVEFPDREPILLTGLGDLIEPDTIPDEHPQR